jgi:hypothetical protein
MLLGLPIIFFNSKSVDFSGRIDSGDVAPDLLHVNICDGNQNSGFFHVSEVGV